MPRRVDRPLRIASLSWILILATALPWSTVVTTTVAGTTPAESGAYSTAKLGVAGIGLFLAALVRTDKKVPLAAWIVVAYAVVTVAGAGLTHPAAAIPDATRAVRLIGTAVATCWVVGYLGPNRTTKIMLWFAAAQAAAAILARLTGLVPASDGRLAGWVPNLHPNALAVVAAVGLTVLLARYLMRLTSRSEIVLAGLPLLIAAVMTGSRTTLGAVVLAVVVAAITRPARVAALVYLATLGVFLTLWLNGILGGNTFGDLATRGGSASFDSTFTGRTDSWAAALHVQHTVAQHLFGQGLTFKTVYVPGEYVPLRSVDGSWHSAYMQGGLIGLVLLAAAVLLVLRSATMTGRPFVPLIVSLVVVSIFESEMNDVATSLVTLLAVAACLAHRPWRSATLPTRSRPQSRPTSADRPRRPVAR